MKNPLFSKITQTQAPTSTILVRLAVGLVFFTEGIQKFLFSDLGVGRFTKLGFPHPAELSNFVGGVEILFGAMILLGLLIRLATIPLIIDILVAIITTKVPLLSKPGFWPAIHEARLDVTMLLCLIFLFMVGAGPYSSDSRMSDKT